MHIVVNILILVSTIIAGIPVPFCFMAAAFHMGVIYFPDFSFLTTVGFRSLNSLTLLSIPFFIMAGSLMSSAGIAARLTDFANSMLGRMRGGLGAATIVACAIFGSISGTCSSAVACIGSIMIPRLEAVGYPRGYCVGMVGNASVLGQLIPPSVPMILYAWVTQQSVAACFLSTVVPGLTLMVIFCVINYVMCRKFPNLKIDPPLPSKERNTLIFSATRKGIWSLLMPVIILGGIYGGITTPTESAAVAVAYSILVGFFIHRELSLKTLSKSFCSSATTSGVICLMMFFVAMMGRVYAMEQVPQKIADFLMSISDNKYVILMMVNLFLVIIGMLMDDLSGTMLTAALLFPLMTRIGVHPIHFAAILGTNLGLGNVTPPCAPILFLAGRVGKAPINEYIKPALIYMFFGFIPIIIITTYIPALSLWLPRLIMGIK